ncbi:vomeronasal type-2 receptor 26-like [Mixophyes fleayi]|uniref:vomeronasal type-2 receptor 26-like n=1 Tax=Mixophyes fleayi TaxID=3061075 RepID=UPI003F4DDE3A
MSPRANSRDYVAIAPNLSSIHHKPIYSKIDFWKEIINKTKAFDEIKLTDREQLLVKKDKQSESSCILFISKFSRNSRKVEHIIKKHWNILLGDAKLRDILPAKPRFIYTRADNLRKQLVDSTIPPKVAPVKGTWLKETDKGFFYCNRCSACKIPKSQCSENCIPGTRKVPSSSIHSCCYNCVQCSEGEISNVTDSENCLKCGDHEWPNEKKDQCVPKVLEFLSYTNDTIVVFILLASIVFCFLTFLILITFILHQDTPIVKANNKNLSFLLLVSIMLSFLSVFLFLGRPVDVSCMLRQVSFGVLFTVAISCVLGKTIMVYIAFKATKPGSSWKRWVSTKLSNCVVLLCSSVQVLICMSWLNISPPFQEMDTYSYQGKIIVQCNEGSVVGFYSVLGYMGVLSTSSFITAFLARTLPDSFNEAKYITFSMLVFCSVWITMIPAYLSTKGKYMVAVEIFAILTSSAGLLGCIFFPKCYIILWRPELNTKKHLLEK